MNWMGKTAVCIASGPSLTLGDCEMAHASGNPSVVTNTTFRLCLWASILYAMDYKWWKLHIDEVRAMFTGEKFCESTNIIRKDIRCAHLLPGFRAYGNSGMSAISLAIALGSRRIIMLGYDCQLTDGKTHWHGNHEDGLRNCETMHRWPAKFARLARYATEKQVQVINASRQTALTCFPCQTLSECL